MRDILIAGAMLLALGVSVAGQQTASTSSAAPDSTSAAPASSSSATDAHPPVTFKAASRMVTVEVVAKDHQGHTLTGLTANDFQVFEQLPGKHGQVPQKIAGFHAISVKDVAAHDAGRTTLPPGVYSNLVTMDKVPVPPTVLLLDGLNTDSTAQMQVHQQMVKMLSSIPDDVPVAVFLLGRRLVKVQDFTTDVKLLKSAIQKAPMIESNNGTVVEPIDDPNSLSAILEDDSQSLKTGPRTSVTHLSTLEQFEREVYAFQMDVRMHETADALLSIARHLAGYPGRKNLLWISSSFPIVINPDENSGWAGFRNYHDEMTTVATALADAKVAVYPMDPGGLRIHSAFQASEAALPWDPHGIGERIQREDESRYDRRQSMEMLAEQTGGIVCVNDNDLGDCVRKAVNDGSSFYEIAYYPDSSNWHDEFHKIVVKSNKSGIRLSYRQGYFARRDGSTDENSKDFQQVGCRDYLTSTSVLLAARQFPAETSGEAKFLTALYPTTVTFAPLGNGGRKLNLRYGVCSFDRTGKVLQFMHQDFEAELTDKQYNQIQSQHGFLHTMVFPVTPGASKLRLLVKDVASGQMGSVNLPYSELTAMSPASPAPSNGSVPAAQ